MSEKIEIEIAAIDSASAVISDMFATIRTGATGATLAFGLVATAVVATASFVGDSVKSFLQYSETVKDFARNTGTSADEASRLIQIGDDVRLSVGSMQTAFKMLARQGIDVSIDSLKDLSTQYLALQPGTERTTFLIQNFGRSGLEMGKLLEKGAAGIDALNSGVESNLVLTDAAIRKAEEYKVAQDTLNDSWEGFKMNVGQSFLPVATAVLTHYNEMTEASERATEQYGIEFQQTHDMHTKEIYDLMQVEKARAAEAETLDSAGQSYRAMAKAAEAGGAAVAGSGESAEDAAKKYGALVSQMERLGTATDKQIRQSAYQDLKAQLTKEGGGLDASDNAILEKMGYSMGIIDSNAGAASRKIADLNAQFMAGKISLAELIQLTDAYTASLNAVPASVEVSVNQTIYTNTTIGGGGGQTISQCFIAGTLITLPHGGNNAIENLRVGAAVISYDTETGEQIVAHVEKVFTHEADGYLLINDIGVTDEHPIYVNGEWIPAGLVKIGDALMNDKGEAVIVAEIGKVNKPVKVYNLEIGHETHNYFAGGVLVHNKAQGGWVTAPGDGSKDTIMTPLANGEYVVNAQAAKRNAGLIESINSGNPIQGSDGQVINIYGSVTLEIANADAFAGR